MRVPLPIASVRLFAFIVLLFSNATAFAAAPVGSWWNVSYGYRQQLTIAAGVGAVPAGYSFAITFNHAAEVAAGRSLANGNDVRIVLWNGTAWVDLDRVLDPLSTWNSASTTVWFDTSAVINTGISNDNYYLYYGDLAAGVPLQNADNVFLFYDDFSAATLNATKWIATGAVTVSGGVAAIGANSRMQAAAPRSYPVDTVWDARVRLSAASGTGFNYWGIAAATTFTGAHLVFRTSGANHVAVASTNVQTIAAGTPTNFQTYSFAREGAAAARFFVNGAQVAYAAAGAPNGNRRALMRNDIAGGTQWYDFVRVRRKRIVEPVLTIGPRVPYTFPAVVAEWRMDQTSWSNAPGQVLDSSVNALHMRAFNGANTANVTPAIAGDPGTCRYGDFNGVNRYLEIADNALLDIAAQLTVTVWVYPRSLPTAAGLKTIVSKNANYEFYLNAAGQVTWIWGAGARTLTTTGTPVPLNQWTHIAITYQSGTQRIYINGVQRAANTQTGSLAVNNSTFQVGQDHNTAGRYWNGLIDEVRIYNLALAAPQVAAVMAQTHVCGGAPHFVIAHDRYGIHCVAETITVNVRDALNNPYAAYAQQVTLDTGTGRGDWSVLAGGGTLNNGVANDGVATYQWSAADTAATFALSYREGAANVNVVAYQTNNPTIRDDDTEGAIAWSPSGFTVTASPLANPPPGAIPGFASPQIAGVNFTTHLTAYGTTPTDTQCGVIETYTGAKSLKFWSTYVNPSSGTRNVAIDGGNIATSEAASSAQAVTFANGQANVTTGYADAGLINIAMKDDTTGNPSLPTGIRGSTGNIVVRPATFVLSAIRRTSDNVANPAASNATDAVFIAAGQTFSATVTAYELGGAATPNFGREATPESVALTSTLVLPVSGQNPAVSSVTGFGAFMNGIASGTDFSWPEVGIITLTPHIRDGDYLGAGDVIGTTTGNVGRFIPNNFSVTQNVPLFQTACASGTFTYLGQPFVYAIAPVFSVTALAATGSTTQNYSGAFFKLTNASLTGRNYTAVSGTLDASGLPAATSDPAIADLTNGLGTLTFNVGTGLAFTRTTPIAPLTAQISLSINVLDSDGVAASNPISFSNIAFSNGAEQRYGRIAFRNAVGSELIDLPLPLRAEFFVGDAIGFAVSTADSCTTGLSLSLAGYGGNLGAGETCLINDGSQGAGGVWCAAGGMATEQFKMPPLAGDFAATLRLPGANNDGTVTVTTVVPSWLRFDWNVAVPGLENPSGIATFGVFKGEAKRIFQREK